MIKKLFCAGVGAIGSLRAAECLGANQYAENRNKIRRAYQDLAVQISTTGIVAAGVSMIPAVRAAKPMGIVPCAAGAFMMGLSSYAALETASTKGSESIMTSAASGIAMGTLVGMYSTAPKKIWAVRIPVVATLSCLAVGAARNFDYIRPDVERRLDLVAMSGVLAIVPATVFSRRVAVSVAAIATVGLFPAAVCRVQKMERYAKQIPGEYAPNGYTEDVFVTLCLIAVCVAEII